MHCFTQVPSVLELQHVLQLANLRLQGFFLLARGGAPFPYEG